MMCCCHALVPIHTIQVIGPTQPSMNAVAVFRHL